MSSPIKSGPPIVAIISVLVGIAILGYLFSGPFRSKVDRQIEQATKWTPENIQKDPQGYLYHAQQQVEDTRNSLAARLIDIAQRRERANNMLVERTTEHGAVSEVLRDLKFAYTNARDANNWPAEFGDRLFSEPDLRARIVEAHDRATASSDQSKQISAILSQLSSREQTVKASINELESTARKIQADLEMVRTAQALEDLDDIQVDLAAITAASSTIASSPSDDSLDAMISERQQASSNTAFEAILIEDD